MSPPSFKTRLKNIADLLTCNICFKPTESPSTLYSCGHSFCFDCALMYVGTRGMCPQCKCLAFPGNLKASNSLTEIQNLFSDLQELLFEPDKESLEEVEGNVNEKELNSQRGTRLKEVSSSDTKQNEAKKDIGAKLKENLNCDARGKEANKRDRKLKEKDIHRETTVELDEIINFNTKEKAINHQSQFRLKGGLKDDAKEKGANQKSMNDSNIDTELKKIYFTSPEEITNEAETQSDAHSLLKNALFTPSPEETNNQEVVPIKDNLSEKKPIKTGRSVQLTFFDQERLIREYNLGVSRSYDHELSNKEADRKYETHILNSDETNAYENNDSNGVCENQMIFNESILVDKEDNKEDNKEEFKDNVRPHELSQDKPVLSHNTKDIANQLILENYYTSTTSNNSFKDNLNNNGNLNNSLSNKNTNKIEPPNKYEVSKKITIKCTAVKYHYKPNTLLNNKLVKMEERDEEIKPEEVQKYIVKERPKKNKCKINTQSNIYSKDRWECLSCTYLNNPRYKACEGCGGPKKDHKDRVDEVLKRQIKIAMNIKSKAQKRTSSNIDHTASKESSQSHSNKNKMTKLIKENVNDNGKAPNNKPIYIAFSNLTLNMRKKVDKTMEELNTVGILIKEVKKDLSYGKISHLIVDGTQHNGRLIAQRTFKYLLCLIHNVNVVDVNWLFDSLLEERVIEEMDYYTYGTKAYGPLINSIQPMKSLNKLNFFDGYSFAFVGNFKNVRPSKEDLIKLISLLDGKISYDYDDYSILIPSITEEKNLNITKFKSMLSLNGSYNILLQNDKGKNILSNNNDDNHGSEDGEYKNFALVNNFRLIPFPNKNHVLKVYPSDSNIDDHCSVPYYWILDCISARCVLPLYLK
ncbi:hypothetical protein K502DRAFT_365737 [Neoconidiobolus thromboides FSU 785]|nr:hypothetical protein K502DRAFT_365737 [Neoconidiobolus thromboides FSU 785]